MRRFVVVGLLTLFASGCAMVTSYPKTWPEVDSAWSECRPPTGSFSNHGIWAAGREEQSYLLADVLFPLSVFEPLKNHAERHAITRIVLDTNESERLRARALVGTELLFERELPIRQEHCQDGRYEFDQGSWNLQGTIGAALWSKMTFRAALDTEGGLILRGSGKGAGLVFMVVPVAGSESTWWRFPPLAGDIPDHPHPPEGVRVAPTEVWQLLPPAKVPKWGSYDEARNCLAVAQSPIPTGNDSQQQISVELDSSDFLTGTRDGVLAIIGWAHPKYGWVPGAHDLRVKKQHWATPDTSERYVECLLALGFTPERRSLKAE